MQGNSQSWRSVVTVLVVAGGTNPPSAQHPTNTRTGRRKIAMRRIITITAASLSRHEGGHSLELKDL